MTLEIRYEIYVDAMVSMGCDEADIKSFDQWLNS